MYGKLTSSYGDRIGACKIRFNSLRKYYLHPNYCHYCDEIIEVGDFDKVSKIRKKKFCNATCYAKSKIVENPKYPHGCRSEKSRNQIRQYARETRSERRQKWFQENGPCKKCGSTQNLETHHLDPSQKIHHSVWSWNEKRRNEELAKCIVLCKECHLEETRKQQEKPIEHGHKGYHRGCRCDLCRKGHAEEIRAYRRKKPNNKSNYCAGLQTQ